jgi:hypothetical protein
MEDLSFERFCEFIRDFARLSRNKKIVPETLFEEDLGITGDDGCELLEATGKRFGIRLSSEPSIWDLTSFSSSPRGFSPVFSTLS